MAEWKSFVQHQKLWWMTDDDTLLHFEEIPYEEALKYDGYTRGAHACIFARDPGHIRFSPSSKRHAAVLMQNRFDGQIGFPGGIVDKGPNELPVDGLNREMSEEIAFDVAKHAFKQDDFIVAHVHHKKKWVAFFYAKEVTFEEVVEIEKRTLQAEEWGNETLGMLRVPLYNMKSCGHWPSARGLPLFLTNRFAGNAKLQLLETVHKLNIIPKEEFESTMKIFVEYCKNETSKSEISSHGKS